MSFIESAEFTGDYLNIRFSDSLTMTDDKLDELWDLLAAMSTKYDCLRTLIEAESPVCGLDTTAAFDSGVKVSGIGAGMQLALCFRNYEMGESSEFFRTVALNRGVRVEYFDNKEKALQWLGVRSASAG